MEQEVLDAVKEHFRAGKTVSEISVALRNAGYSDEEARGFIEKATAGERFTPAPLPAAPAEPVQAAAPGQALVFPAKPPVRLLGKKTIAVVAIALIAAAIVAWWQLQPTWKEFNGKGYSVEYFSGWETTYASGINGSELKLYLGESGIISVSGAPISKDEYVSGRPPTLEEFGAAIKKSIDGDSDFRLLEFVQGARAGSHEAVKYKAERLGEPVLTSLAYLVVSGDKGYLIMYVYAADLGHDEESFNRVVGSFRLTA